MKKRSSNNNLENRARFRVWPEPRRKIFADGKVVNYGATLKQQFLFLEQFREDKRSARIISDLEKHMKNVGFSDNEIRVQVGAVRPHQHPLDIILFDGGNRSGKTVAATARVIQYLLENPGSVAVIGAENHPLLERSAKEEWRKRFTIHSDWDHPLIARRPTQQSNRVRLTNGSSAWFIHFSDYKILRGLEADIIHIEEASLLPSEDVMNELIRRLSGSKGPLRQLILTTNPEESHSWLFEKFNLKQFDPKYEGEPLPIPYYVDDPDRGKCACQFCSSCYKTYSKKITWINGICPECDLEKEGDCPGGQQFFRVLRIASFENAHLPPEYVQNSEASMSEEYYNKYLKGHVTELRSGRVYKGFRRGGNIKSVELDPDKPLYWSFDFNISYQCSVLCQDGDDKKDPIINVVDEIVLPESGPEHVAIYFLHKYRDYKGKVYIYGDPSSLRRAVSSSDISQFQTIYNVLTDPKKYANLDLPAHDVEVMVKKEEGKTRSSIVGRVDATNAMLLGFNQEPKIFVHERCRYLIRSLEDMRWKEGASPPGLDKACDKRADKSPDKKAIHLMSHITDSLSYLIYKRFPIVGEEVSTNYLHIPGNKVIEMAPDGTTREYSPFKIPVDKTIPPPEKKKLSMWELIQGDSEFSESNSLRSFW